MTEPARSTCELCVIGSGMAGLSAALFAANRGIDTVLIGRTGEIIFATGLLDLMGVHPVESGRVRRDPFAAVASLVKDIPSHPYARLSADAIRAAFDELVAFLGRNGLAYTGYARRNAQVLTSAGTLKVTYRVPATMWRGVRVSAGQAPCLLVDIQGMKGFSARQIAAVRGADWPALRTATVSFPDAAPGVEVLPERLARSLEVEAGRARFAAVVRPLLRAGETLGLPAILGVSRSSAVCADFERRIGAPLFEIPVIPPGTTGLRLKETFERGLAQKVRLHLEASVLGAATDPRGVFLMDVGRSEKETGIAAQAVILATGRFMGGGLRADRHGVHEPLFGLPVFQPEGRECWHREDFLDPRGHPINRAGIETDADLRPLDGTGRRVHPRLFAAGSILAHQDWMRMKCGAGIAIATAYAAVENLVKGRRGGSRSSSRRGADVDRPQGL
jgi:glycerol-3-phosphate dehydrogenase subunit B